MAFGMHALSRTGVDALNTVSKTSHIVSNAADAAALVTATWASHAQSYHDTTLAGNKLSTDELNAIGYQSAKMRIARKQLEFSQELKATPGLQEAYDAVSKRMDADAA